MMLVLDASAVVELLLGTSRALALLDRLEDEDQTIHAPHLLDVEVLAVLRRLAQRGLISAAAATRALDDYRDLGIERHAHEPLLERAWTIRENVSAADAMYVALAEALPARLLTFDVRLVNAPGLRGIVAQP
jgi:predicted nucleic acid-binding protein